ncbi:AAA family ATPase [bacterium]|nr:AAA family ATPase [bacterium]
MQKKFLDIIERKKNSQLEPIDKAIIKCYKSLESNFKDKGVITGTPIGIEEIDNVTNGFQRGDLIILAARPGMGKTAIALNFIFNAAKDLVKNKQAKKKKIVLFSLEMGKEQICRRLISLCARTESIDSNKLRNCNFSDNE